MFNKSAQIKWGKTYSDGKYSYEEFTIPGIRFNFVLRCDQQGKSTLHFKYQRISDIHWGTRQCRAKEVACFLRDTSAETLDVGGDGIDGERCENKDQWNLADAHEQGIAFLPRRAAAGEKVTYEGGNHDIKLLTKYLGTKKEKFIRGIRVTETTEFRDSAHQLCEGKHGHQYDEALWGRKTTVLYYFGSNLLDAVTWLDERIQLIPRFKNFSIAALGKKAVKTFINLFLGARRLIKKDLIDSKFDVMFYGHTHMAQVREIDVNEYRQSLRYKLVKYIIQNYCGVLLDKMDKPELQPANTAVNGADSAHPRSVKGTRIRIDDGDPNAAQKAIKFFVQDICGFYLENGPTKLLVNSGSCTERAQCIGGDSSGNYIIAERHDAGFKVEDKRGKIRFVSFKALGVEAFGESITLIEDEHTQLVRDHLVPVMYRLWSPKPRREARQRVAEIIREVAETKRTEKAAYDPAEENAEAQRAYFNTIVERTIASPWGLEQRRESFKGIAEAAEKIKSQGVTLGEIWKDVEARLRDEANKRPSLIDSYEHAVQTAMREIVGWGPGRLPLNDNARRAERRQRRQASAPHTFAA